jgi:aspartate-semialdehyde dehydrogenase
MLSILEERNFPVDDLRLMASSRSAGTKIETRWGEVEVEDLDIADPSGIDVALFSAGADRSRGHAERFVDSGAVVIDNSSAFRQHPDVPLVVAGVNDHHLGSHQGLIANPNCTTMALMVAVGPLHRAAGVRSIVANSYQAVSGSGAKGVDEMLRQTRALLEDPDALRTGQWKDPGSEVYVRPIAFNALPYAGTETELGYTDEEWKLVNESRKILDAPDLDVEPTCVRVPAVAGHGVSATLRFERPMTLDEAMEILSTAPGGELWKDTVPTALDAAGRDEVLIGRVRPTLGEPGGINLWVVGDNLRKGAALNTIEIAERL